MKRPGPRRQAAVREAALAVVAHLHGLRVNRLRLEPGADGHELLDHLRLGLDLERLHESQFLAALKRAEIVLAGQLAVERYLDTHPQPADDLALAILDRLGTSARQREALAALARARLLDLLDAPDNRALIETLAQELERDGELDRDAFMLVVLRTVKLPA